MQTITLQALHLMADENVLLLSNVSNHDRELLTFLQILKMQILLLLYPLANVFFQIWFKIELIVGSASVTLLVLQQILQVLALLQLA